MRHPREDPPTLITDAPESLDEEFDRRRKRYAIMMAIRAICVIVAALVYRVSWPLAIVLVVCGAVLPWCAVILANDRAPKNARRLRHVHRRASERALPPGRDERTVDG